MKVLKSTLLVIVATLFISFSAIGLSNGFSISADTRSMFLLAMAGAGLIFGAWAFKELSAMNSQLSRAS